MKRSIVYISCLVLILTSCEPDPNTNPNENHFRMTVNGTELSTLPENVNYLYIANVDTIMGIFAAGGTVVYNSLEVNCFQAGTYPIVGHQPAGTGGLLYHSMDSVYYIDNTHGSGSVTFETWNISPGTIHELKGNFSGTAATDHGHTVTITNGDFYYHEQ